jgi:acetyl-CoA C-acetyltransferase
MSDARDVVIIGAARTPIGKFQGTLAGVPAPRLGAVAIKAAVERSGIDPAATDEVLMGCVVPAGQGQAPARQASVFAGMPMHVGATTINKVCGSGLKTAMIASAMISRWRRGTIRCRRHGEHERLSLRAAGCSLWIPIGRWLVEG